MHFCMCILHTQTNLINSRSHTHTHTNTDRERTSFEELRKAYIRETRQVLLDKAFEVECSDEDEIDQETEEGTLPDVQSTSRSLTSDTDPADAADPDGGEWSGQTSQSLQTENR